MGNKFYPSYFWGFDYTFDKLTLCCSDSCSCMVSTQVN